MATRATTATRNTTPISTVRELVAIAAACVLACFGYKHFRDGVARDAAIPVPVYMIAQRPMPMAAYSDAISALRGADAEDGVALQQQAEAERHAGYPTDQIVTHLEVALAHAPALGRGWLLLGEESYPQQKSKTVGALSLALFLSPREYWLAGPLVFDAARFWPDLDADTRRAALDEARMLWSEPLLRPNLQTVASTREGSALLTRAFSGSEIRAINRWLAQLPPPKKPQ